MAKLTKRRERGEARNRTCCHTCKYYGQVGRASHPSFCCTAAVDIWMWTVGLSNRRLNRKRCLLSQGLQLDVSNCFRHDELAQGQTDGRTVLLLLHGKCLAENVISCRCRQWLSIYREVENGWHGTGLWKDGSLLDSYACLCLGPLTLCFANICFRPCTGDVSNSFPLMCKSYRSFSFLPLSDTKSGSLRECHFPREVISKW